MSRIKCFTVAAVVCFPSAGLAQAFTFEDLLSIPCGASCPFPGIYLSVSQTIGGQTLTVTPVAGGLSNPFIFAGNSGVPLLGAVSLDGLAEPNPRGGPVLLPLRFSFLNPVSAITFAFGVNGGPDIGPARIQAFDTFGNVLGVFDTPYPANKNDGATQALVFGGSGASYFLVSRGTGVVEGRDFYWEVAASTPTTVPEPASVALVGSGLIILGAVYRRRASLQQRRSRV